MKAKRIFAVAISTLLGASLVFACRPHGPAEKAEWIAEKITSKLDLEPEQVGKLDALKAVVLNIHQQHQAEREQTHKEMLEQLGQDTIDRESVTALARDGINRFDAEIPAVVNAAADF